MGKYLYHFVKRPYLVFKRHILTQILEGNFSKPWHFSTAIIKHKFLGYPYVGIIEIGNYCNLQCPTCPTPHNKIYRKKELMSFENFKKVIDNIKDSVHVVFLYNANEPLLHPDISQMARYAHKNNLYTLISTNATLLNKEKTRELFESGLDEIILCLDGVTKESYEPFRTGANFEVVMGNIKNFCQQKQNLKLRKPYVELQFILNKLNQNEIEDIKELAKKLKVDRLHIKSFALGEYAYSKKEIKRLSDEFFPDAEKYQYKIRYKMEKGSLKIKTPPPKCSMVKSQFVVLVDGKVSMCCYDLNGEYTYGNILNQKLKDIWFNPTTKDKRKLAENRKYPLCKTCSVF